MKTIATLFTLFFCLVSTAQVGIGTETPNPSAQLDIFATSGDKGILIPRVSLTGTLDATTITTGNVESLLVYNTATVSDVVPGFYYWSGTFWQSFIGGSAISETVTRLVDNLDGTITYYDENNTPTTVDVTSMATGIDTDDQTITAFDFNNTNNQLAITLEDGNTATVDLSVLNNSFTDTDDQTITDFSYDASNEELSITLEDGNTATVGVSALLDDTDTDDQTITAFDFDDTNNELAITLEDGNTATVDLSVLNNSFTDTDDQTITDFSYDATNEELSITLEDGNTATVGVSALLDNTDTDDQTVTDFSYDATNEELSITLEDGNTATVDVSALLDDTDTDDQTVTDFSYDATNEELSITLEDGNTATVGVSALLDNTDTDDQTVTDFSYDATNEELSITLEDGNTATVDVSALLDDTDTDDQTVTDFSLDDTNHQLSITLEDGNTTNVDLSALLKESPWQNPDGSAADPTSTVLHYPNGNVGIGTNSPSVPFHIKASAPATPPIFEEDFESYALGNPMPAPFSLEYGTAPVIGTVGSGQGLVRTYTTDESDAISLAVSIPAGGATLSLDWAINLPATGYSEVELYGYDNFSPDEFLGEYTDGTNSTGGTINFTLDPGVNTLYIDLDVYSVAAGETVTITFDNFAIAPLAVASNTVFRLEDGTEAQGKILTSDAMGNASWQDLPENETLTALTLNGTGDAITYQDEDNNSTTVSVIDAEPWRTPSLGPATNTSPYLHYNGDVGIGTNTPEAKLHLRGISSASTVLQEDFESYALGATSSAPVGNWTVVNQPPFGAKVGQFSPAGVDSRTITFSITQPSGTVNFDWLFDGTDFTIPGYLRIQIIDATDIFNPDTVVEIYPTGATSGSVNETLAMGNYTLRFDAYEYADQAVYLDNLFITQGAPLNLIRIDDGNQAVGKILTSDADGNGTWEDAPSLTETTTTLTDNSNGTWTYTNEVNTSSILDITPYLHTQTTTNIANNNNGTWTYTNEENVATVIDINPYLSNNAWGLTGNSGTDPSTDFVGTTDARDLVFRTNDAERLRLTTQGQLEFTNASNSVYIGEQAGENDDQSVVRRNLGVGRLAMFTNTSGSDNTALGFQGLALSASGDENTALGSYAMGTANGGSENTAIGYQALLSNTANDNTAVGHLSLRSNTSGTQNVGLGSGALYTNTTGNDNTAIGAGTLNLGTTASNNTAVGTGAMNKTTTGDENTAVGRGSLNANTTGVQNVAIGRGTMVDSETGSENTALGYRALNLNIDGGENTAVGKFALGNNVSGNRNTTLGVLAGGEVLGSGNVMLGYRAGYNETGSDQLYIDNSSTDNPLIKGDFATDALTFNGGLTIQTGDTSGNYFKLVDGNQAVGKVLTSDADGNASWQDAGAAAGSSWSLTGNSGTDPSADFVGTTDARDLVLRTNDAERLRLTTQGQLEFTNASNSVYIGEQAGENDDQSVVRRNLGVGRLAMFTNTSGSDNTALGFQGLALSASGDENTALGSYAMGTANGGSENTAIGYQALLSNTANDNTAVGHLALRSNTSGTQNVGLGSGALYTNTTGNDNTAIGAGTLNLGTTASNNTAVGTGAMNKTTTGDENTAVGRGSLNANTTGVQNVAIGRGTMVDSETGSENTALGYRALNLNIDGGENTAVGKFALGNNVSGNRNTTLGVLAGGEVLGSGNVMLGYRAGYNETGSDQLYIDNSSTDDPLIKGDFATDELTINGKLVVTGKINAADVNFSGLPVAADDTAAAGLGLATGDMYRTASGELRIKL